MSRRKRSGRLMVPPVEVSAPPAVRVRLLELDAFRGLAMLAMLVDHLMVVLQGPAEVRLTVGRLAMPAFFLLAGYLARAPRWRHLGIAVIGILLPIAVPWIDSPNVLVLWALGVVLLWAARYVGLPVWLIAALGLTVAANGWASSNGSYDQYALWGLMALGSMLPASAFSWAAACPLWVAQLGRWPVWFYVGHLLALQGLVLLL